MLTKIKSTRLKYAVGVFLVLKELGGCLSGWGSVGHVITPAMVFGSNLSVGDCLCGV